MNLVFPMFGMALNCLSMLISQISLSLKKGLYFFITNYHLILLTIACFKFAYFFPNSNSFSAEESSGTQSQQLSSQSQMLTQSSSMTQYSSADRFMNNGLILPLNAILNLPEVVY
jgi:hypothetical protein